jgi:hypothetical protein
MEAALFPEVPEPLGQLAALDHNLPLQSTKMQFCEYVNVHYSLLRILTVRTTGPMMSTRSPSI